MDRSTTMHNKVEEIINNLLSGAPSVATDSKRLLETPPRDAQIDILLSEIIGTQNKNGVKASCVSCASPILTVPDDQRIITDDLSLIRKIVAEITTGKDFVLPCGADENFVCEQAIKDKCPLKESGACPQGNAEPDYAELIKEVMAEKRAAGGGTNHVYNNNVSGIYETANDAIKAALEGFRALSRMTLKKRSELIESIRRTGREHAQELARIDLEETGMGRYEDKIAKLNFFLKSTPGVEDIRPEILSGDGGMTVIEHVPYGVVCCITPSTGVQTTPFHNAICMIASGNSAVFCPHPNALKSTLRSIELINQAIAEVGGPANIITSVSKISQEITGYVIKHPDVKMVVATGGPGIVKTVLSSGKKAVGAGAGNPPVFVDDTADIPRAAKSIVAGNHFENGIQCICEKEIIVMDSVADRLIAEMQKAGAYLLSRKEDIDRLTDLVTANKGPNKDYIGKDPSLILRDIGINAPADTKTIIFEAPRNHIIATDEYLMSILPIIRVKNVDEGILLSAELEGGRRHTAVVHSKNVEVLSKYPRVLGCTIIVKNGPSFAGVGMGGEGFGTPTIAGPTGEGITSPRSFTRMQRCVMVDDFNLRGAYPY